MKCPGSSTSRRTNSEPTRRCSTQASPCPLTSEDAQPFPGISKQAFNKGDTISESRSCSGSKSRRTIIESKKKSGSKLHSKTPSTRSSTWRQSCEGPDRIAVQWRRITVTGSGLREYRNFSSTGVYEWRVRGRLVRGRLRDSDVIMFRVTRPKLSRVCLISYPTLSQSAHAPLLNCPLTFEYHITAQLSARYIRRYRARGGKILCIAVKCV